MSVELEEFEPGRWRVKRKVKENRRSDLIPLPYVISDIMEPTEQVDGRFYTSKRAFRAVGRSLGLIEVGNEKLPPRQRASVQKDAKTSSTAIYPESPRAIQIRSADCRSVSASMSDTSIAPPGATPTAAAPAPAHETPINPNPVNAPNPIGPQAPDKSPAEGRREAIQRAFDRANTKQPAAAKPAPRAAPAPAEAKAGHNQPPEPTPQERIDLRKRPQDQPRGDRGQFAPRQATSGDMSRHVAPGEQTQTGTNNPQLRPPEQGVNPLPAHAPFREPPPRMAERAKAEWHAAPESVRGEVHRMNQEFANAYQQYRGDHEVMNSIRPFHDLAAKHKTTLQRALTSYVTMENRLRADPIAGLDQIVNNLGIVDPQSGQRIGLRDIAYHVLTRSPEQLQQLQQGNAQQAATQQIGALHREISNLQNTVNQMHTQQQFGYTRSAIDQFAESRPRFDELGDLIHAEVQLGFDLETAYRRAELLRPATHAAQTRTPPAQTRPVDRSIYGAPDGSPSNGTQRHREPSKSPREAVQRAIRQMNGSL